MCVYLVGGSYWTKLLSMPVLPRALAENIESRESGNPASITFIVSNHVYDLFLVTVQFVIKTLPSYPWWNSKLITVSFYLKFLQSDVLIAVAKRIQIKCSDTS